VALLRRAVLDRDPDADADDVAELYSALGQSLVRAGRPKEAVSTLRTAVAERPRDEALLYALAHAFERAGQPEAALGQMRALLALNPDHAEALNFVGYMLADKGVRLEEAERLVRRALALKPRAGHVLDSLGWVLFRRGDYERAVAALERADTLTGPDAVILAHLGDAYRAVARLGDAEKAYRRALASVPEASADERDALRASIERKLREVAERAGRGQRRAAP
jgi:Flp pilus assembly protein TadD